MEFNPILESKILWVSWYPKSWKWKSQSNNNNSCKVISKMSIEAIVCASCPEHLQGDVTAICKDYGIQKAFGKPGDMIDSLKGKDWVPKWQAKVVMAVVTKAQTLNLNRAKIICIMGGKNCDEEMAQQPALVRAIKKEIDDPGFMVKVEWMEFSEFRDTYSVASPVATSQSKQKPISAVSGKASNAAQGNASGTQAKVPPSQPSQNTRNESVKSHPAPPPSKGSEQSTKSGNSNPPPSTAEQQQQQQQHRGQENSRKGRDTDKPSSSSNSSKQLVDEDDICYVCGECEQEFKTENACLQHQSSTGHRNPECANCGKTFGKNVSLVQHCESTGHTPVVRKNSVLETVFTRVQAPPVVASRPILSGSAVVSYNNMKSAIVAKNVSLVRSIYQNEFMGSIDINGVTNEKCGATTRVPLLHFAATSTVEIVQFLIACRANINGQSECGETALMHACAGNCTDIVRLLLENGANMYTVDYMTSRAAVFFIIRSKVDIMQLFLANGFNVDAVVLGDGFSLIAYAFKYSNIEMMTLLLSSGANPNKKGPNGRSALEVARSYSSHRPDVIA